MGESYTSQWRYRVVNWCLHIWDSIFIKILCLKVVSSCKTRYRKCIVYDRHFGCAKCRFNIPSSMTGVSRMIDEPSITDVVVSWHTKEGGCNVPNIASSNLDCEGEDGIGEEGVKGEGDRGVRVLEVRVVLELWVVIEVTIMEVSEGGGG